MPAPELPANEPPGSTIRAIRKQKGWTLQTLADKSGLDKATISRVERNDRFELATLKKIGDGLGVDLSDLFTDANYAAWKLLPKAIRTEIEDYAAARIKLWKQHKKITDPPG